MLIIIIIIEIELVIIMITVIIINLRSFALRCTVMFRRSTVRMSHVVLLDFPVLLY